MSEVKVIDHPLIQHKLTLIRDKNTGSKEFRELVEEVAMLMAFEVTRDLPLEEVEIETPLARATSKVIKGRKMAIIPILRAGLGMSSGILRLIPGAKLGHIGMYRDHDTLQPVVYYAKFPEDIEERDVLLVDPMLATGGSVVASINYIKEQGAKSIKLVALVAAPEGIKRVQSEHSDVNIYTAAIDERLNDKGYIIPGLGDCGDRLFGTK